MIDAEAEHCREVYAMYGLAMYCAQCLEKQIAISLATVFGPDHLTSAEYDKLLESNTDKTMGRLTNELARQGKRDERAHNLVEHLTQAKDIRNLLAHNYFWQRATQFVIPDGREAMLAELREFAETFTNADAVLTELTMSWAANHSIRYSHIQEIVNDMIIQAQQEQP